MYCKCIGGSISVKHMYTGIVSPLGHRTRGKQNGKYIEVKGSFTVIMIS